jgi:hypothetical protein
MAEQGWAQARERRKQSKKSKEQMRQIVVKETC